MVNANGEFGPPDDYDEYDSDWYDDEDEDYDPLYDFDDYGVEVNEFAIDYDETALSLTQRIRGELAYRRWKFEDFGHSWTGTRLRNRFRRCGVCGKRNRAYWSDNGARCVDCEIPF